MFKEFGIDLYKSGFSLYSFTGLTLVYLFFQIPLMVLVLLPVLDGLKPAWREAAENLGASPGQYWRYVALPVMLPSILGTMILLFGNAFGAHATAYALTGGMFNLATLLIGQQISGDVLHNPGLGYAVAMGMVTIMALSIFIYSILQRRSERWLA
jgi:putative spermidine/putrescine transport system permease protein